MVFERIQKGMERRKADRRADRFGELRKQILKARAEGEKEGEKKGISRGVNMAVFPIGLASAATLLWQYVLRPDDMSPPMSDALSPPPATAPADMDEVDSRARDPWFNRQYAEQINASLILPRSEDSIVHDRNKIKNVFKYLFQTLGENRYANIPVEIGTMITHQAYYQAIEESVIREAMGNSEAGRAELEQYWNGLPQDEKKRLGTIILEIRDIHGQTSAMALISAQEALDAFLEEHREYQISQQVRGR